MLIWSRLESVEWLESTRVPGLESTRESTYVVETLLESMRDSRLPVIVTRLDTVLLYGSAYQMINYVNCLHPRIMTAARLIHAVVEQWSILF